MSFQSTKKDSGGKVNKKIFYFFFAVFAGYDNVTCYNVAYGCGVATYLLRIKNTTNDRKKPREKYHGAFAIKG